MAGDLLSRDSVPPLELPTEQVAVPALGGAVLVRGMDMPQMLRFNQAQRRARAPREGETEQEAHERAGAQVMPMLLEMCVLASDMLPVYSAAQWGLWWTRHPDAAIELFNVALRLSGQEPEPGKP